jgi:predicted nucleic acid-binding protein
LVVTDTGPLIHLSQADVLSWLEFVGDVQIPETVLAELEQGSTDISTVDFTAVAVDYDEEAAYPHLDPGETAALTLCSDIDATLLTDDLDARDTANEEDIEVHGSVGVVLSVYSMGKISEAEAKRVLRALKQDTNLYLAKPLLEHAIELVEADDTGW